MKAIYIVCMVVLIGAIMVTPAVATTWYVHDNATWWTAFENQQSGDTIFIYNGTYGLYEVGGYVNINNPNVTVIGEGADVVTLDCAGSSEIRMPDSGGNATGSVLDGITVVNANRGVDVGYWAPSSNCIVRNCVFDGMLGGDGAITIHAPDTTVENNVILNPLTAFGIYSTKSCTIVNNTIINARGNPGPAIMLYTSDCANSMIARNNVTLSKVGFGAGNVGPDNKIYLNNFVDNDVTAMALGGIPNTIFWNSTEPIDYTYGGSPYTNYLGNNWGSDYTGSDAGEGIGDVPYVVPDGLGSDFRPLVAPFENYPESEPAPPDSLEFGDAPDPTHPSLLASDGARHTPTDTECLGLAINGTDWKDFEPDANVPDLDFFDDGLLTTVLTAGNLTQTVSFEVTNMIAQNDLLVNILLDLNQNGIWDSGEHVVQNQPINLFGPADDTFTSDPFSTVGATGGLTWMRITLTRQPINTDWDGTMASAGYAEPFGCGETEDWLVELQVPPKATVYFVPDDIRLPKYCDTTNVSVWIDTEEAITSGQMIFDYTYCCMNVTDFRFNATNWNVPPSGWAWAPGRVTIMPVNLIAGGVGPGLVHVGDLTVHCCNDTGYCFTDLTWDKDPANSYLFNATPAKMTAIGWHDGTFRCNIPDLVITAVKGNEINATHYNVSYTVKNIGEVNASESYANLLVDGSQVETMFVPALAPGAEYADSFELEIEQTGTVDSLLVCADYDDAVVELDENNCMIGRYPGEVVIKVQPVVTYVQPQDQFDVKIYVDTKGIDVYAVQYRLTYNTSIVRAETQTKDTFLGSISETMVVVNEISQPYGEVAYAETRKVPGAVTESDNATNIHFIAIGVRGATTPLTLDDIIISNEDGVAIAYVIEDGEVVITENTAPVPVGVTKHRINNVAQKYQSTAILCSCSYDPDYPGKGGNITYIRWAFGDGQYGTSEGLPVDNCTCKEHKYESWQWDPLGDSSGDYVPFDVQLDVMDDGCPELNNKTNFTIDVYIAGDANGDGEVNILDAVWVGKHWRETCSGDIQNPIPAYCEECEGYLWGAEAQKDGADLNNDCEVNILDAVIVGANWRHVAW